uniref:Uncharacterized protein n=1 Tax=Lysobacter sp. ATCC 53042 TaxID=324869 RepID=F8TUI6_9GAMM|nr:unknown [Lysobacter sp. ATCC 53042]
MAMDARGPREARPQWRSTVHDSVLCIEHADAGDRSVMNPRLSAARMKTTGGFSRSGPEDETSI